MEFGVGSIVKGKVSGITKFGAFVTLPEGKSGLVHISEIAYAYVNEVSEHLQVGQEVTVKVIGIDDSGRINLSIKKALPPPPRDNNRPAGNRPQNGGNFRPRENGGNRGGNGGFTPRAAAAPKEPSSFEDKLKQFMQASDSKLSELRAMERSNRRRGGNRW